MGNCLVTKLKETVDNSNLETLGCIVLHFVIPENPTTTNNNFNIKGGVRFELSDKTKKLYSSGVAMPNGYYVEYRDDQIGSKSFQLLDSGSYDLIIKPKYNLNGNFYIASTLKSSLDLSTFEYTDVTSLIARRTSNFVFTGDISSLKNHAMTTLSISDSPSVTGDFVEICGPMTSLTSFMFGNSKVTGDIVEFVRRQVKAGRSTYTFDSLLQLGLTKGIKFNGNDITNRQTSVLTWDDNTDPTKTDITLTTGSDEPMTVTVSKLL